MAVPVERFAEHVSQLWPIDLAPRQAERYVGKPGGMRRQPILDAGHLLDAIEARPFARRYADQRMAQFFREHAAERVLEKIVPEVAKKADFDGHRALPGGRRGVCVIIRLS